MLRSSDLSLSEGFRSEFQSPLVCHVEPCYGGPEKRHRERECTCFHREEAAHPLFLNSDIFPFVQNDEREGNEDVHDGNDAVTTGEIFRSFHTWFYCICFDIRVVVQEL